jgi:hypothetical protein
MITTMLMITSLHCPMPADCNTTKTMDTWYACKARQSLQLHKSPDLCKSELLGMGASKKEVNIVCHSAG